MKSAMEGHFIVGQTVRPAILIFFLATISQLVGLKSAINLYDEGIILFGAEQVLHGKVPYRDFWTMYGPGQFYLTSLLYKIFGVSDLVIRVYGILIKAVIVSLAYIMVNRFASSAIALVASIAILLLCVEMTTSTSPVFPALMLALCSILYFDKYNRSHSGRWLYIAGLFTGLVTTFRHDLGAYNALAIILTLLLLDYVSHENRSFSHLFTRLGKDMALYSLGLLSIVLPVFACLVYLVPVADLYLNLIEIPGTVYPAFRSLPFPDPAILIDKDGFHPTLLASFAVYTPYLLSIYVIVSEIKQLKLLLAKGQAGKGLINSSWGLIPLLTLTNLLFSLKGVVRVSEIHMLQSFVLSIILLAISVSRVNCGLRSFKQSFSAVFLSLMMVLLLRVVMFGGSMFIDGLNTIAVSHNNLLSLCTTPLLPRLRCVASDQDYVAAAKFVKENSAENDLIYVGTGRHDKIYGNAVAFYFIAERRSMTKWAELHPGIQTTEKVQRNILAEMQEKPPRFVILDNRWDKNIESNQSAYSSGVTLLDDYIQSNFKEINHFGSIRILSTLPG